MKYEERKLFRFDTKLFKSNDVVTALAIQHEYVVKHSGYITGRPAPRFFEVDREATSIDPLWHNQTTARTQFSRVLDIPAINYHQRNNWVNDRAGLKPTRTDRFWLSHLSLIDRATCDEFKSELHTPALKEFAGQNYFPTKGDCVFWDGYRYELVDVVVEGSAYWQQSGVWLGIVVVAMIVPDGDAPPLVDLSERAPSETPGNG